MLNPQFSWSQHSLGDCYKKLEDWPKAAVAYQSAVVLNPDFVWSYYSLGEVLEQLAQWEAAAQVYRQVLTIDSDNEQAPARLAIVLHQLLQQDPRNVDYYKEFAEQQIAQGKTDEAISAYQMALQIQPSDSALALKLSTMLSQKDPQLAHSLLDRALSSSAAQGTYSPDDLSNLWAVEALLTQTHLFDPVYYRATNPEIADRSDRALLRHYIEHGSAANRNPNPLFDEQYYRARHPEIVQKGINSLAHYHQIGYKVGDDPHPFFSGAFYQRTHADVAATAVNPLEHYLGYGAKEGRAAFSEKQCSQLITAKTPDNADYLKPWQGESTMPSSQRLGVYCNSLGNYFITEIADFIAAALSQSGHTVIRLSEADTPPESLDGHWVIAPHEFFYLGEGAGWAQKQRWLSQAVMVNVEQPQTTWFSKAFHFLRHTKVIFDINVKSAAIMQKLGLPAYWLPLGYLPNYAPFAADEKLPDLRAVRSLSPQVSQRLPALEAPLEERPLDIHFIGTLNSRREQFFAKNAAWLSRYRCFFHIPPMGVPLIKGQDQALDTAAVVGLSRRSKILLNIHRDALPYFEWHRIIFHGLWQNTLVVTEPCHDIPGLVAGEHFIECPLSDMEDRVGWLLMSYEGQKVAERVRQAGHQALKEKFDGIAIMRRALALANAALGQQDSTGGTLMNNSHEYTVIFFQEGILSSQVTVCISLYNYQQHIVETLQSVHKQTQLKLDLVVVEDRSTDDSLAIAKHWLEDNKQRFNTVHLAQHNQNQGLSAARNTAIGISTTPYVFILDADNLLYPRCIERCLEGLEADPQASVAYPIVEKFGEEQALIGNVVWDRDRFKRRNCVDAMSLIRSRR